MLKTGAGSSDGQGMYRSCQDHNRSTTRITSRRWLVPAVLVLWLLAACAADRGEITVEDSPTGDGFAAAATAETEGDGNTSDPTGTNDNSDDPVDHDEAAGDGEGSGRPEADGDTNDQPGTERTDQDGGGPSDDTSTASGPSCSTVAGDTGVDLTWQGFPDESEIEVSGDGELLTSVTGGPDGVLTLFGMTAEDGSRLALTFSANGKITTVGCGSATMPAELAMPDCSADNSCNDDDDDDDDEPQPLNQSADLAAAAERFDSLAIGPHVYLIITDGDGPKELYMSAGADGSRSFDPALSNPAYLNPFTIHDELAAAIETGAEVEYRLDPSSGLPTWWSVDGTSRTLLCLQLDTAPPDLRTGPCDPAADLIGR